MSITGTVAVASQYRSPSRNPRLGDSTTHARADGAGEPPPHGMFSATVAVWVVPPGGARGLTGGYASDGHVGDEGPEELVFRVVAVPVPPVGRSCRGSRACTWPARWGRRQCGSRRSGSRFGALGSDAESRQSWLFDDHPSGQVQKRVGVLNMSPNESLSESGKQLTPGPRNRQRRHTTGWCTPHRRSIRHRGRDRRKAGWVVLQIGRLDGQSIDVQQLPDAVDTQRFPHNLNCGTLQGEAALRAVAGCGRVRRGRRARRARRRSAAVHAVVGHAGRSTQVEAGVARRAAAGPIAGRSGVRRRRARVHRVPHELALVLGWQVPEQSCDPAVQTPLQDALAAMQLPAHTLVPSGRRRRTSIRRRWRCHRPSASGRRCTWSRSC